ncbi:MAG TPA: helix-turn-helix domain-containing protein [Candidatus Elarobacter sp.]
MSETFGERVRRLRAERGLSVSELAAAVGAADGTIRQIETGTVKSPNFHLGIRLAKRLRVDPAYLAGDDQPTSHERLEALEHRLTALEERLR